jgi:poly-D-alanine transfer protein DltD
MITIEQKREAVIDYETAWLMECNDGNVLGDLLKHGWEGWKNMPDEAVEKFYKENIEEEDDDL